MSGRGRETARATVHGASRENGPAGARGDAARAGALVAALFAAACTSPADSAADGALAFYQRHLGEQWAFHCDFQPSCSSYGREAVAGFGAAKGLAMTADRLQRDHALERGAYEHDEHGRPLDPPRDAALFGPRVEEEERAHDAALAAALAQAPPLAGDEEAQLAFADRLWDAREWAAARIEYERLLAARPGTRHAARSHERCALALAKELRRGDALAHVARIDDERERAAARALVERELGRPRLALDAAGAAGQPLLEGFLALEAEDAGAARRAFATFDDPLRAELLGTADAVEARPRKSALLAGSMSALLPGSGQLYAGRPGDALAAFSINALLIGGTVAAARNEEKTTAIALGFVSFGFWTGNVYGAANGARRHDRATRDALLDRARGSLRQSGLFAEIDPEGRSGALGLYFGF